MTDRRGEIATSFSYDPREDEHAPESLGQKRWGRMMEVHEGWSVLRYRAVFNSVSAAGVSWTRTGEPIRLPWYKAWPKVLAARIGYRWRNGW